MIILHLYHPGCNRENKYLIIRRVSGNGSVELMEMLLGVAVRMDLYVAFFQQGDNGGVVIEHVKRSFHTGYGNGIYFSSKKGGFRGYDL